MSYLELLEQSFCTLTSAICVVLAYRGTLQHRRTVWQWTGQARHLQDGLDAACQLSGHVTINVEAAHRLSAGWTGGVSSLQ
jgi:hypothetical protein